MASSLRLSLTLKVEDSELLWHRAAMAILDETQATAGEIEALIGTADCPDIQACVMQLGAIMEFAGCRSADQRLQAVTSDTGTSDQLTAAA